MFESFKRVRLLYIVLAVLLLVGLLPLGLAGVLLSRRSAEGAAVVDDEHAMIHVLIVPARAPTHGVASPTLFRRIRR